MDTRGRIALFIAIILLLALLHEAKAGWYVEGGIGKNGLFSNDWEGRDSTACMLGAGYAGSFTEHTKYDIGWAHYSQCTRGQGFDSRPEDSLDSIIIKLRYEW